jgi:hypothetical protein
MKSYRVSERVLLEPGDQFRVTGGPYYVVRLDGGERKKVSMAARGPFTFVEYEERRGRKWIVAYSNRDGGFSVLPLTRRKSILPGGVVARPYRVTSKIRKQRAEGIVRVRVTPRRAV